MINWQQLVWKEYCFNGFKDKFDEHGEVGDIAELGLVVTEVAEAMEAVRNGEEDMVGEECADIIIRVLNFMSRHGIDAETEVLLKDEKNRERSSLHGKLV